MTHTPHTHTPPGCCWCLWWACQCPTPLRSASLGRAAGWRPRRRSCTDCRSAFLLHLNVTQTCLTDQLHFGNQQQNFQVKVFLILISELAGTHQTTAGALGAPRTMCTQSSCDRSSISEEACRRTNSQSEKERMVTLQENKPKGFEGERHFFSLLLWMDTKTNEITFMNQRSKAIRRRRKFGVSITNPAIEDLTCWRRRRRSQLFHHRFQKPRIPLFLGATSAAVKAKSNSCFSSLEPLL